MIKINNIELIGVQHIYTDDQRHLIEQQLPGSQVAVLQDLGRHNTRIYIEGLVWGEESLDQLAALHDLQLQSKAVDFVGDIANGLPLKQVIVEKVKIIQQSGYKDYYTYVINLLEAETKKSGSTVSTVSTTASGHADTWASNATATSVTANPNAVTAMPANKAASNIVASAGVDPSKTAGMMTSLQESGGLAAMVEDFADADINLEQLMSGLDLPIDLAALVGDFSLATDYVKNAKNAAASFGDFSSLFSNV